MFIKFNEESQKALKKAKLEMQKLCHPFVGSEHLVLSILSNKNSVSDKLNEYGVDYDIFHDELLKSIPMGKESNSYFIYTPLLKRILEEAIIDAKERNCQEITLDMIFLSVLDEGEGVAVRLLTNLGINIDELFSEISNNDYTKANSKKKNDLLEFGIDLNKMAKDNLIDPLIGRDDAVNKLIEILMRRTKNNPLLIGEAGVGKTAIVEELANRIVKKMVPKELLNSRIISISMSSLVAGTKYRGEFEERINKVLKELENNDNIIVFIDEIHTIVGAGGAEGAIDASNIIKPALARGKIKLIGATTTDEYKKTIENDRALCRRFQTVLIKEVGIDETENILKKIKYLYEEYHYVKITDSVIDQLVELSTKYIYNRNNPDKSIDILDSVCTKVSLVKSKETIKLNELEKKLEKIRVLKNDLIIQNSFSTATSLRNDELILEDQINNLQLKIMKKKKAKNITVDDVASVIEERTGIPIYEVKKDYNSLNKLTSYLKNKVIGQDEIIEKLAGITKRIKLGYKNNNLPFSLLFIGGTGVGKTYLVKEYSKYLKMPLIKLDMSEYRESHTISKIIGSPPGYVGYDNQQTILEKVVNNPYSIILLDEIEKASSTVINLFLQVLDEGIMTSSNGKIVNFSNAIIIMTSNIGGNRDNIGFSISKSGIDEKLNNELSTEFVNRINEICYFNKLTKINIHKIVNKKVIEIKNKFNKNSIKIKISKAFLDNIINESEYEIYGARKISKLLESKLDDLIIDSILKGSKSLVV